MPDRANDASAVLVITDFPAWRAVRALSRGLEVLTLDCDNAAPRERHPAAIAHHALALLAGAGIQRAHVYGFGRGGLAAQELAAAHPDRVCRLVLAATATGGRQTVTPDQHTRQFLARVGQMPP